jgi:hypothetical protein
MRQMTMDLLQAAYGPTLLGGAMIGLSFGIFWVLTRRIMFATGMIGSLLAVDDPLFDVRPRPGLQPLRRKLPRKCLLSESRRGKPQSAVTVPARLGALSRVLRVRMRQAGGWVDPKETGAPEGAPVHSSDGVSAGNPQPDSSYLRSGRRCARLPWWRPDRCPTRRSFRSDAPEFPRPT